MPDHPVRWAPSDAVLVLLGTQVLSFLWATAVIVSAHGGTVPDPMSPPTLLTLNAALWVGYGLGPVLVARGKGQGPVADYGARATWLDVPVGLVIGVVTQLVVLPLVYVPLLRLVDGDPSESARALMSGVAGPADQVLLGVSVVIVAPAVEELFYRGLLLRALQRRLGTAVAVVGSAALFALVHRDPLGFPGLFVFGLLTAGLTLRTGRLGPAWAMHAAFNATTLLVLGVA